MHQNYMLAASGEHLMELDDTALSVIVGGDGIREILKEVVKLLWDCVSSGLDDVIDAAEEGYSDAQGG
jgi:hypothetical protein